MGEAVKGPVLPPVHPPTALPTGTCDWGRCDSEATGVRWDAERNEWLAVCERHLAEAPNYEWVRLA